MLLKRKRSDDELASPTSTSQFAPLRHLGGRTIKRFRDGRPSEEEIHKNTLSILYGAQRSGGSSDRSGSTSPVSSGLSSSSGLELAAEGVSTPVDADSDTARFYALPTVTEPSQPSLHRFWGRLQEPQPQQRQQQQEHQPHQPQQQQHQQQLAWSSSSNHYTMLEDGSSSREMQHQCKYCGDMLIAATRRAGAGMHVDDPNGSTEPDVCARCTRAVCSECFFASREGGSIAGQQCGLCGGRQVWVGGVGWVSEGGMLA